MKIFWTSRDIYQKSFSEKSFYFLCQIILSAQILHTLFSHHLHSEVYHINCWDMSVEQIQVLRSITLPMTWQLWFSWYDPPSPSWTRWQTVMTNNNISFLIRSMEGHFLCSFIKVSQSSRMQKSLRHNANAWERALKDIFHTALL